MEQSVTDISKWLPPVDEGAGKAIPLFCLPYAGGGASIYRQWPKLFSARVRPVPLRFPGREMRILESPIGKLDSIVDALITVLHSFTHQPYALFGHSMGALIAHELTQRLVANGIAAPRLLVVSGRQAPHIPNPDGWESVRGVSDSRFVEILVRMNAATETVLANSALYELLLPTLRADFSLCEDYVARPPRPLPVPILAFGGAHDPSVSLAAVRDWAKHTERGFSMEAVEGDHFFINTHAAQLCHAIEQHLFDGGAHADAALNQARQSFHRTRDPIPTSPMEAT